MSDPRPPATTADRPRSLLASAIETARSRDAVPLVFSLVVTAVVFRVASPLFLSAANLGNLLGQLAPLVLIAVASTVMIVMGEIDLSLGSVAGFSGAVVAILITRDSIDWELAVLVTLAAGVAIAGMQGVIVLGGRVRSFVVTLAGFFIWYGAQVGILGNEGSQPLLSSPISRMSYKRISEGTSLTVVLVLGVALILMRLVSATRAHAGERASYRTVLPAIAPWVVSLAVLCWVITYLGRVPLTFVLVLGITAIIWIVLTRTGFGRHLYAVGGNPGASRANGINVGRVKLVGFLTAGVLAACAGITIVSFTGGADTSTGAGSLLLEGIGATVVGGVSLLGGRGSVWGAFGGAVLLAAVQNGLALLSLDFYVVDIVEGLVVLAALLADSALRHRMVSS
jgi:D-xylose transport system permease protein